MKKITTALALIFVTMAASAQVEQANYKTAIDKFTRYYNNNLPDSLFKMFSAEVKAGLPLDKTKDLVTQMHAQIGNLKQTSFIKYLQSAGVYKADYEKATLLINLSLNGLNQVDGLFFNEYKPEKQGGDQSVVSNIKAAVAAAGQTPINDPSLTESPVTLSTLAGTLSGTLTVPKDAPGKVPVVLIIAGSGPTDRDGNSTTGMQPNIYKMLARELGKAGIATLRYDKRGIGQSKTSTKEAESRFTDMVDDAAALTGMLKEDTRFSKVIILGHSEGSLVGMLTIASAETPINGFISAAGAGDPAEVVLTEQLKSQPTSVTHEFKRIVDSLRRGKVTDKVDPALYSVMRPSIQKYMMSWMQYDPQRVIKRVKIPILIVQGTTDMQIGVDQAEKLKKAKSEATLKIIPGMSHILKAGPADKEQNFATYNQPDLPLKPEFVAVVIDFVKGLK
jgi:pimeloyl-ACP methyl ester carboxylesterase